MSKDIHFNLKSTVAKGRKILPLVAKHASFMAVLVVLIVYLFVVWKISQLADAEPSAAEDSVATAAIPKVDKNAIKQIEALEQSNTEIHSLFDSARKNPFSE